jgi:hypothetical protein
MLGIPGSRGRDPDPVGIPVAGSGFRDRDCSGLGPPGSGFRKISGSGFGIGIEKCSTRATLFFIIFSCVLSVYINYIKIKTEQEPF